MSALHWEARRKQVVINRRAEAKKNEDERCQIYNDKNIQRVAEDMSADTATPINSLLHRSQAKLVQKTQPKDPENDMDQSYRIRKPSEYSAKIPNRYTSINYTQQY